MPISVHNASYLRTAVQSHKQKVKSLYKRACRNLESWVLPDKREFLVKRVELRQRFEEKKNIKDLRKAKVLLMEGEQELFLGLHPKPLKFPYSPGGICYERYYNYPDQILDWWHPLEKAVYPHYFARREARKEEYCKMWEKKHGMPAEQFFGVTQYQDYQEMPETEEGKMYGPFAVTPSKTVAEFPATKKKEDKKLEAKDSK